MLCSAAAARHDHKRSKSRSDAERHTHAPPACHARPARPPLGIGGARSNRRSLGSKRVRAHPKIATKCMQNIQVKVHGVTNPRSFERSVTGLRAQHCGVWLSSLCVRPRLDPGPSRSASASTVCVNCLIYCYITVHHCTLIRVRTSVRLGGALPLEHDTRSNTHKKGDPRARPSDSYVQIGRMQSVVPDSLGISVSLAGRN